MKYCEYCGEKLDNNSNYCSGCGKRVKKSLFQKCPNCNVNSIGKNKTVCDKCYKDLGKEAELVYFNIEAEKNRFNKGFEKFYMYIDCVYAILSHYKRLFDIKEMCPDEIEIKPGTLEEVEENVFNSLVDTLEEKIVYVIKKLETTGDLIYLKQLEDFKSALEYSKKVLPDLQKSFKISDVDNILEIYK